MKSISHKIIVFLVLLFSSSFCIQSQNMYYNKKGYNVLPNSLRLLLQKDSLADDKITELINYAIKHEKAIGDDFFPLMITIRIKSQESDDSTEILRSYHHQGKYFNHVAQYNKAIESYEKALEIAHKMNDTLMIISYIGSCYRKQSKHGIAVSILYDVLNMAEVSKRVGFYGYFYFSKCFKSIMNISPSDYIRLKKRQRAQSIIHRSNTTHTMHMETYYH